MNPGYYHSAGYGDAYATASGGLACRDYSGQRIPCDKLFRDAANGYYSVLFVTTTGGMGGVGGETGGVMASLGLSATRVNGQYIGPRMIRREEKIRSETALTVYDDDGSITGFDGFTDAGESLRVWYEPFGGLFSKPLAAAPTNQVIGSAALVAISSGNVPLTSADDKLKNDELPDPNDPFLDDCKTIGEALIEVFKSVRRRRVELDPRSNSYVGHANVWGHQKNILNKFYSKFTSSDRNCDDNDLPPGSSLKDVLFETSAKAPKIIGWGDFFRRGGAVPALVLSCTLCPACCAAAGAAGSKILPRPATVN